MKVRKIFIALLFLAVILTTKTNAVGPEITATSGVVIDCIDGYYIAKIWKKNYIRQV